jgi:hypothetical protein
MWRVLPVSLWRFGTAGSSVHYRCGILNRWCSKLEVLHLYIMIFLDYDIVHCVRIYLSRYFCVVYCLAVVKDVQI